MKVVAIIPESCGSDKMLVEMTCEELGLIESGMTRSHTLRIGSLVRVGKHWERIKDINKAQAKLNASANSLRALADLLETIPVVVPPSEPEPAKEGGAA